MQCRKIINYIKLKTNIRSTYMLCIHATAYLFCDEWFVFSKKKRIQNPIQNMLWKYRKEKGRLLPCSWAAHVAAHFLPLSVFGRRPAPLIVLSHGPPSSHPLAWPSKPVQDTLPSPSPLGPPLLFLLRSPSGEARPAWSFPFSLKRPILG